MEVWSVRQKAAERQRAIDREYWESTHSRAYDNPEEYVSNRLFVERLLKELPGYLRNVIVRTYWLNQTQEEISRMMLKSSAGHRGYRKGPRITRSTVAKRKAKALEILRGFCEQRNIQLY